MQPTSDQPTNELSELMRRYQHLSRQFRTAVAAPEGANPHRFSARTGGLLPSAFNHLMKCIRDEMEAK